MLATTPVDFALLNALARYRLLTVWQAERLGIARHWHIRDRLRALSTARLVDVLERGRMNGPNIYSLTPKGAATLEAWAAEDGTPRTVGVRRTPYRLSGIGQRLCIVDVHIGLRQWAERAGATLEVVRVEFDPNPVGLEPATNVVSGGERYTPDAIFEITDQTGERWLFALEVETGGVSQSLDNFRARLSGRLDAFAKEIFETGWNWPRDNRAARLLFVFQTPEMQRRAVQMVGKPDRQVWKRVFFNSLPAAADDFAAGWSQLDGSAGSPMRAIRSP